VLLLDDEVGVAADEAAGVLLPAEGGAAEVLVATAVRNRRDVSSVLVTLPLMMSDAITPGLW
jgi:hypothetical protein